MFYLVLYYITGYGVAMNTIPQPYPTEQACHEAAKINKWSHSCVPAPVKSCVMKVRPFPSNPQLLESYKDCE